MPAEGGREELLWLTRSQNTQFVSSLEIILKFFDHRTGELLTTYLGRPAHTML